MTICRYNNYQCYNSKNGKNTQASWGEANGKMEWCFKHKGPTMINLRYKQCEICFIDYGIRTRAYYYNAATQSKKKTPTRCHEHKEQYS